MAMNSAKHIASSVSSFDLSLNMFPPSGLVRDQGGSVALFHPAGVRGLRAPGGASIGHRGEPDVLAQAGDQAFELIDVITGEPLEQIPLAAFHDAPHRGEPGPALV